MFQLLFLAWDRLWALFCVSHRLAMHREGGQFITGGAAGCCQPDAVCVCLLFPVAQHVFTPSHTVVYGDG